MVIYIYNHVYIYIYIYDHIYIIIYIYIFIYVDTCDVCNVYVMYVWGLRVGSTHRHSGIKTRIVLTTKRHIGILPPKTAM